MTANINRLIEGNGISKRQLAQELGISYSTLWNITAGIVEVKISKVIEIAAVLKVDVGLILISKRYSIAKSAEIEYLQQQNTAAEQQIAMLTIRLENISSTKNRTDTGELTKS